MLVIVKCLPLFTGEVGVDLLHSVIVAVADQYTPLVLSNSGCKDEKGFIKEDPSV